MPYLLKGQAAFRLWPVPHMFCGQIHPLDGVWLFAAAPTLMEINGEIFAGRTSGYPTSRSKWEKLDAR